MDNVSDGSSLTNNATVNLVGPLVIGFEMQTDNLGQELEQYQIKEQ